MSHPVINKRNLMILDIKKTSKKKIYYHFSKRIKISKDINSFACKLQRGIKLLFYCNPKFYPLRINLFNWVADDLSEYTIRKIGAYMFLERIEEMFKGSKIKIPAKYIIDEVEESEDGKTYIPIGHFVYCNVKIKDKNLIGLEMK